MDGLSATLRIALVGMYGGMWREYNPGCYMIARKTLAEMRRRIPGAIFDVFSIDNRSELHGCFHENIYGLDIQFFSRSYQLDLLDNILSGYDALIIGGDIVWGGDDVTPDNDIFFVNSPAFRRRTRPSVLFNSVHTFYDDRSILGLTEKFAGACERASYVSVRTPAIKARLERIIPGQQIRYVPDPVLDLDMPSIRRRAGRVLPPSLAGSARPVVGLSFRASLIPEFLTMLDQVDFGEREVLVFPYSRQYHSMEGVRAVRRAFGPRFHYIERDLDPFESFAVIGDLDLLVTDTFHGAIAAIIQDVPFISVDVEPEITSRKEQLLSTLGSPELNVRLRRGEPGMEELLVRGVGKFVATPSRVDVSRLAAARAEIGYHFYSMAQIIHREASVKPRCSLRFESRVSRA